MPARPPVLAASAPPPEALSNLRRPIRRIVASPLLVDWTGQTLPPPIASRALPLLDLHQLVMCRFYRRFRRHALDRLRVHVDDDVLSLHLGGVLGRRSGIAQHPAGDRDLLERGQDRVDA